MHLDFIGAALTLLAVWVVGNKNKAGFLIAIISNIVWITYSISSGHSYGVVMECGPLLFINLRNYYKWKHEERC